MTRLYKRAHTLKDKPADTITSNPNRKAPFFDTYRLLLLLAILLFIGTFTYLAFDLHLGMRTHKADLGQIAQAVWNSSRGRFVEMTDNGFVATRMTDHVEPFLALISPILWGWNDVRALLFLQVVFVAIGAWPLYELTLLCLAKLLTEEEKSQFWQVEPLRRLTRPMALSLAVAYLLAPQLQAAVLTEFHAAPLATPLILWSLWAIESRRWGHFTVATLLTAGVKEEMALLAAGLALWALYRLTIETYKFRKNPTSPPPFTPSPLHPSSCAATDLAKRLPLRPFIIASSILIASLAWFYIATFVIVPAHAAQVYNVETSIYLERYGPLGSSFLDIIRSFFQRPQLVWQIATMPARLSYLWNLFIIFGFLSLLTPELILIALPLILANLLSTYPAQYYGEFHYSAPLIPFFAAAAAYGMGRIWLWLGRRANQTSSGFQHLAASDTATMTAAAIVRNSRTVLRPLIATTLALWLLAWAGYSYTQAGAGPLGGRYDPTPITAHHRLLKRFTQQIPAGAAVTATAAIHPHVALRRFVYQFPIGLPELGEKGNADWALLDVTTNSDLAPGDLKQRIDALLLAEWGVIDAADGFLLLRKGAPDRAIPDAFFDFARASKTVAAAVPQEPKSENRPLTLVDLAVDDWPRWRQTKVISRWRVGTSFDPTVTEPWLELRTPNGDHLYDFADSTPPALLWYPPERWQPDEIIEISTLPLYLPRIWGVVAPNPFVAPLLQYDDTDAQSANSQPPDSRLTVVDAFVRRVDGALVQLSADETTFVGSEINPVDRDTLLVSPAGHRVHARFGIGFLTGTDAAIALDAAVINERVWPGATINVQLLWSNRPWPQPLTVFVHLRRNGKNVVQSDGLPRRFVLLPLEGLGEGDSLVDWRQLTVSSLESMLEEGDDDPNGEWSVVIGLYDPTTGQRAELLDSSDQPLGNELIVSTFMLEKAPVPDQACALNALACASQPK